MEMFMAKRKSVFTQSQAKTTNLQVKVTEDLKKRVADINEQLKDINPKMKFDSSDIMVNALLEAVMQAETELSQMKNKGKKITEEAV